MKTSKTVSRLGIDLGKSTFHLWGVDRLERLALRKKLTRHTLLKQLSNMPRCLIGMEACGSAHHWARELEKLGHEVKLIAPQFVKPYVKGNKNDYNDAEAICEAVGRPSMRFVGIKSVAQQELLALHRIRQSAVKARTAQANQIRGLLAEFGVVIGKGISQVRRRLPEILEDGENPLGAHSRDWLRELLEHFLHLDGRVQAYDRRIEVQFNAQESCQRLAAIEGVGKIGATAIVATFGKVTEFANGRQFSAALGLVPRQHSTGGREVLLGISKRGDRYLRTLLIHGARSVVARVLHGNKDDARSRWIRRIALERGINRAAVALANKNARIIWALLRRDSVYQPAV